MFIYSPQAYRTKHVVSSLSSAEALPQCKRKAREKEKAERLQQNVLFSAQKFAVLGMCNNSNGSDSRRRICAGMHMVGFKMEPRDGAKR